MIDITDAARLERFVEGAPRRYAVTFYYPTLTDEVTRPYAEKEFVEAITGIWPVPEDFGRSFCVSLAKEGAMPPDDLRVPVIFFSPGLSWPPIAYSSLLIDLASQGYIVAAISHPHAVSKAIFADGTAVDMSLWPRLEDEQERQEFLAEYLETWIGDLHHLGRAVEMGTAFEGGPLQGHVDLAAGIGLLGHSYGASAAVRALDGKLFRAALIMEGRYRGPENPPVRLGGAVMHMIGGYNRTELEGEHYRPGRDPLYEVIVHGAGHASFSDLVLLYSKFADDEWKRRHRNEIDPSRAIQIIRAYAGAFFDAWLKARDSPYLHPVSNAARFDRPSRGGFPEVELQIDVQPAPVEESEHPRPADSCARDQTS